MREGEGNPRKEGKGKGKEMGQEEAGIQEKGWRRKWIARNEERVVAGGMRQYARIAKGRRKGKEVKVEEKGNI